MSSKVKGKKNYNNKDRSNRNRSNQDDSQGRRNKKNNYKKNNYTKGNKKKKTYDPNVFSRPQKNNIEEFFKSTENINYEKWVTFAGTFKDSMKEQVKTYMIYKAMETAGFKPYLIPVLWQIHFPGIYAEIEDELNVMDLDEKIQFMEGFFASIPIHKLKKEALRGFAGRGKSTGDYNMYNAIAWMDTGADFQTVHHIVNMLHIMGHNIFARNKANETAIGSVDAKFKKDSITQEEKDHRIDCFLNNLSEFQVEKATREAINKYSGEANMYQLCILKFLLLQKPDIVLKTTVTSVVQTGGFRKMMPKATEYDELYGKYVGMICEALTVSNNEVEEVAAYLDTHQHALPSQDYLVNSMIAILRPYMERKSDDNYMEFAKASTFAEIVKRSTHGPSTMERFVMKYTVDEDYSIELLVRAIVQANIITPRIQLFFQSLELPTKKLNFMIEDLMNKEIPIYEIVSTDKIVDRRIIMEDVNGLDVVIDDALFNIKHLRNTGIQKSDIAQQIILDVIDVILPSQDSLDTIKTIFDGIFNEHFNQHDILSVIDHFQNKYLNPEDGVNGLLDVPTGVSILNEVREALLI